MGDITIDLLDIIRSRTGFVAQTIEAGERGKGENAREIIFRECRHGTQQGNGLIDSQSGGYIQDGVNYRVRRRQRSTEVLIHWIRTWATVIHRRYQNQTEKKRERERLGISKHGRLYAQRVLLWLQRR